jgi:hypothetical protein
MKIQIPTEYVHKESYYSVMPQDIFNALKENFFWDGTIQYYVLSLVPKPELYFF